MTWGSNFSQSVLNRCHKSYAKNGGPGLRPSPAINKVGTTKFVVKKKIYADCTSPTEVVAVTDRWQYCATVSTRASDEIKRPLPPEADRTPHGCRHAHAQGSARAGRLCVGSERATAADSGRRQDGLRCSSYRWWRRGREDIGSWKGRIKSQMSGAAASDHTGHDEIYHTPKVCRSLITPRRTGGAAVGATSGEEE